MNIMSAYGLLLFNTVQNKLIRVCEEKNTVEEKNNTFKYHDPFANKFLCRHIIDDHNNIRHYFTSM